MEKAEDDQDSDREEYVHEIVLISRLKKFHQHDYFSITGCGRM